ncbi:hypothetical protein FOL47_000799 [Perkinsus chesapeaki]|uniref:Reverse transcriptase domain-containing protein n=1 Tax=Perkinsus chesapeaki TaxID=330153 RepID=A0A7J6KU58_PERCH|nr:hypothetical protein FOL47_000799 [Perkinsus chesapeaki]
MSSQGAAGSEVSPSGGDLSSSSGGSPAGGSGSGGGLSISPGSGNGLAPEGQQLRVSGAGGSGQGNSGGGSSFPQPEQVAASDPVVPQPGQVAAGLTRQEDLVIVDSSSGGGEAGLCPGSELVLPPEVVAFIREKLIPSAQFDVSDVLMRRGIAAPELFRVMGDCSELISDLRDPANVFALRAVAAVYSPQTKNPAGTEDSGAEELVESLRLDFETDYGVRVPSRYLVSAKVFSKLSKVCLEKAEAGKRHVVLDEAPGRLPAGGNVAPLRAGFSIGLREWRHRGPSSRVRPRCCVGWTEAGSSKGLAAAVTAIRAYSPIAQGAQGRQTTSSAVASGEVAEGSSRRLSRKRSFVRELRKLASRASEEVASDIFCDAAFKDGGACLLPGRGSIADALWEAGLSSGFSDILGAVAGAPTEDQVERLRERSVRAAGVARTALAKVLGVPEGFASPGNCVDGRLLASLTDSLGVDDREIGLLCQQGLPIGVSRAIPSCPLFPKYVKKKHPPFPVKRVGEGFRNYSSMSDPSTVKAVGESVRKDELMGFVRRLTPHEAADPLRTFVPRGAIPKKDGGIRVVDDYLRANVNLRAEVPNTASLPSVVNTRRLVGELQQQYPVRKWLLFELDLESAYRFLKVHEEERKHLSFCHVGQGGVAEYFENCSLPFGLNSSGFWFVRYVRAVQCCLGKILRAWLPDGAAAGLMYVDDGLWIIDPDHYLEVCTVISLLWTALGSPISFKKIRVGRRQGCFIGVTLDVDRQGSASFYLAEDKLTRTKELLAGLVSSGGISMPDLASLAGKLSHYCQLRPFLKAYLQPYFGLKSVMESRGLKYAKCPSGSEVAVVSRFFSELLAQPNSAQPAAGISRAVRLKSHTIAIATDASLTALGGVLALSGSESPSKVCFFRTPLEGVGSLGAWACMLKDLSNCREARNMVALELLAAALGLVAAQTLIGDAADFNVVLYTDNTAVQSILTKMYSPKPALARLLRSMTALLSRLALTTFLRCAARLARGVCPAERLGSFVLIPTGGNPVVVCDVFFFGFARMAQRRENAARFLAEAVVHGQDVAGEVARLVRSALAPTTRRTYTSAEKLFRDVLFGEHMGMAEIYPMTAEMLLTFVYVLDKVGYPYSTIRTYVSGLKTQNLERGYELTSIEGELIKRGMTAVRKKQPPGADRSGAKETVSVAQARAAIVRDSQLRQGHSSLAVALRLCLFGLLRCRECLALRCLDVYFEQVGLWDVVRLTVRRSKTDQYAAGVVLRLGCAAPNTGRPCLEPLCPVHSLYAFMCDGFRRKALTRDGYLFGDLAYTSFLRGVKEAFGRQAAGNYGTHSLRRSGSRWMWLAGVSNFEISQFGRWSLLDTLQHRYLNGVAKGYEHRYATAMVSGCYRRPIQGE